MEIVIYIVNKNNHWIDFLDYEELRGQVVYE